MSQRNFTPIHPKRIINAFLILILAFAVGIGDLGVARAIIDPGVVDQSNQIDDYGYVLNTPDDKWQEFLPTMDILTQVEWKSAKHGSPTGNVTLEIRDNAGNTPALATKTMSVASMASGWNVFAFASPLAVTPGVKYRIYVYIDTAPEFGPDAYMSWRGDRDDSPYSCCTTNYGITTFDFDFKTYGKNSTTTTITNIKPSPGSGQTYTVDVSVSAISTPTGTVDIDDGDGNNCQITLSAGVGSCVLTSALAGTKTITAQYNSPAAFNDSSTTKSHTVHTEIFADGFESGDINAWSSTKGASLDGNYTDLSKCHLCVGTKGAIAGAFSLKVKVANNKPHYLVDSSPDTETHYIARFYVKIKGLSMGNLNNFKVFQSRDGKKAPFFLQVRKKGAKYQIRAVALLDNGKKAKTKWTALPKKPTAVEVDWMAAANKGSGDGHLMLYINGKLKDTKANLKNSKYAIQEVRLGMTTKVKAAFSISGSFLLDDFDSDYQTMIGP